MTATLYDLLLRSLEGGLFTLLGLIIATIANRRKSNAETERARAEIERLEEETEKLRMENERNRAEQINTMLKQNIELLKAKDELKAKLHIANEEKLLLSKELSAQRIESIEYQKQVMQLSDNQRKIEQKVDTIKKQTDQLKLPARDV